MKAKKETLIEAKIDCSKGNSLDIVVGDLIQEPDDVLRHSPILYNVLHEKGGEVPDDTLQQIHLVGLLLAAITQDVAGSIEEDVLAYADIAIATKAINKVAKYDIRKVAELCAFDDPDPNKDEAYGQILKDSRAFDHNIIREIEKILEDEEEPFIPLNNIVS